MPWTESSGPARHSKAAGKSKKSRRQWKDIANSALKRGYSEGAAVRMANGVVKKRGKKRKSSRAT